MHPLEVLETAPDEVERAEALDGPVAARRGPGAHRQPVPQVRVAPGGTVLARLPEDG